VRSREQVKLAIKNRREAVTAYDAQARTALEQGREDLVREALRWKAFYQEKLSKLEAELRHLTVNTPTATPRNTPASQGAPPAAVIKPAPTPFVLIMRAVQEDLWLDGPGGAAVRALKTDVNALNVAVRDLTTAMEAANKESASAAAIRLQSVAIDLESHSKAGMAAPLRPDAEIQRCWASLLVHANSVAIHAQKYAQAPGRARADQLSAELRALTANALQLAEREQRVYDEGELALKENRLTESERQELRIARSGARAIVRQSAVQNPASQVKAVAVGSRDAKPSVESLLAQLDSLTGLAPVKLDVRRIIDMARVSQMRQNAGLPVTQVSRHLIFTGNPGTGKTTVARLLAELYAAIGILRTGQLVEVTRSDLVAGYVGQTLVAGYVGQTATKTTAALTRALGGVLFIDEAYSLARSSGSGQDFGLEAIDTIVKMMEDYRDQLIVIVAGYGQEMTNFVNANPGLPSRFPHTINFPDYSDAELVAIFSKMCSKNKYEISLSTLSALEEYIASLPRERGFGNGRMMRNIFEDTLARQASRIVATGESNLTQLTLSDLGLPSTKSSQQR
jgi:Holliday junction resolvasome RuvABC ATP-dependent DNA helicase subunit